jgi:hypothetical protein
MSDFWISVSFALGVALIVGAAFYHASALIPALLH